MSRPDFAALAREYRRELLEDCLPFWLPRSIDGEHGGFLLMRDRDGSLLEDDKGVWTQARFLERHARVREWSRAHFADPEYGEWYGYLRRDGSVANTAKGNLWKRPFHLPCMLLVCAELCEELAGRDLSSGA